MTPESATRALTELRSLKPNWNSYKARAITDAALKTAAVLLTENPQIVPCSNGGIQIEWHTKGIDFEFRIAPDGREDLD